MRCQPVFVQVRNHCKQDVLASIQFRLLFIAADCKANVVLTEAYGGLESCHLIPRKLLRDISGLHLELHLGNLSQQRYLICATGCKVPILQEVFVVAQTLDRALSEVSELILHLIEADHLLLG